MSAPSPAPCDRAAFVGAMRGAVTGVHLVTTGDEDVRLGLTVSAIASVSADPPMLLACIRRGAPIVAAIEAFGAFSVNTLAHDQGALADTFAGRPRAGAPYDFGTAAWAPGPGTGPMLAGAAARFACRLADVVPAGSHAILLADVLEAGATAAAPLAYTGGSYARPIGVEAG